MTALRNATYTFGGGRHNKATPGNVDCGLALLTFRLLVRQRQWTVSLPEHLTTLRNLQDGHDDARWIDGMTSECLWSGVMHSIQRPSSDCSPCFAFHHTSCLCDVTDQFFVACKIPTTSIISTSQ